MAFVYEDVTARKPFTGKVNLAELDACSLYLRHYDSYLYLQFISKHSETTHVEKQQALKELTICERKLEYWKRHPNFDINIVTAGIQELKAKWQAK